jgi:hypothetical protein
VNETTAETAPTYALRAGVVAAAVHDETLLLDLESGVYYSLNTVGTPIWEQVAQGRTPAEIVAAIVDEYDVPPEVAAQDVQRFLDRLVALGLMVVR